MRRVLALVCLVTACARPAPDDHRRPAEVVARLDLAPEAVVADIGAGAGAFTFALARAVPRGRVIATEVLPAYLESIAARARTDGVANVETRLVSAEVSGLGVAEIDVAFLSQVDHYLRDRRAYLGRLATALRPGGRVVILNHERERPGVEAAARELGWRELDRWTPAAGFFARSYAVATR